MNNTEKMLSTLAGKLGMTPGELKEVIEKGDMSVITADMNEADTKKFKAFIDNPEFLQRLLKNSQS